MMSSRGLVSRGMFELNWCYRVFVARDIDDGAQCVHEMLSILLGGHMHVLRPSSRNIFYMSWVRGRHFAFCAPHPGFERACSDIFGL